MRLRLHRSSFILHRFLIHRPRVVRIARPALPAEIARARARELDTRTGACPHSRCLSKCRLMSHAPRRRSAKPAWRCSPIRLATNRRTGSHIRTSPRTRIHSCLSGKCSVFPERRMVSETGVEPVTAGITFRCSTSELLAVPSSRRSDAVHGTRIVDARADDQRRQPTWLKFGFIRIARVTRDEPVDYVKTKNVKTKNPAGCTPAGW